MTKFKNFKQKLAALVLAAVSVVVPAVSFLLFSSNAKADTVDGLEIGEKIAEYSENIVVKDTICVKRREIFDYTLYYMGTFDDVFVDVIHLPMYVTSFMDIVFEESNQIMTEYDLTYRMSENIKDEFGVNAGASLSAFFATIEDNLSIDSSYSHKYEKSVEVVKYISITSYTVSKDTFSFTVDGVELPYNHYYGDVLLMFKANKFKLTVHKQQIAKHRSSALAKWGDYQIEDEWDGEHWFYSAVYNKGNFVRKIGNLGTREEYEKMIGNVGK